MTKKNQKDNTKFIVIGIIIVAVTLGVYLVSQKTNFFPKASTPSQQTNQTLEKPSDLDATALILENTDPDQLDQDINKNTSDASSF